MVDNQLVLRQLKAKTPLGNRMQDNLDHHQPTRMRTTEILQF
jgi:hypothetical protein